MNDCERMTRLGQAVVVVVVAAMIAGQLLGQPVLLGFVETGSMSPTINSGDGFIAVPSAVAGEPTAGDVIVFEAEELNGGGLTTHRVVRQTDRGYITRGDANPFPDQAADEPPVKRPQIVAHALQVGGGVVVIPRLGDAVLAVRGAAGSLQRWLAATLGTRSLLGTQGLTYILLAISALGYLYDLARNGGEGRTRQRSRERSRSDGVSTRLIVLGLAAVVVVAATAAMTVPGGTQKFQVLSAEFDSEDPEIIRQGGQSTFTFPVPNDGVTPVHAYVEPASDGASVSPNHVFVPGRGTENVSVTLSAPPDTGLYSRYIVEHRYLAVLPEPVIRELLGVHPWLPILVIDAVVAAPVYLLGTVVIGGERVRLRRRDASRSSTLGGLLRSLYP